MKSRWIWAFFFAIFAIALLALVVNPGGMCGWPTDPTDAAPFCPKII